MSRLRREEREDRTLEGWDTWIDRAIRNAQQRGDFDDLPGAGKPLQIYSNPLAPEWDVASGILKDAGVAPFWVELDKEILAEVAALAEMREGAARYVAQKLARRGDEGAAVPGPLPAGRRRWWPFRRFRGQVRSAEAAPQIDPVVDLEMWRERARQDYLERAARLDRKIAEYHNALPGDLWWLQKPRVSTETAAREFDEACPSLQSAAWRTSDGDATQSRLHEKEARN